MSVNPTLVELILNAPAAGKAMLSAVSAAAQKTLLSLVKGDVGLGNVDNTSDANKPVSTAQQTALNLKANLAGPTLTGTTTVSTLSVGGNVTVVASALHDLNIDDRIRHRRDGKTDGGLGDQFFFGDTAGWSTSNGGAAIGLANNFHAWWSTNDPVRVEFEADAGEMQFYIEGGVGKDSWFGLQEGSAHKWSFGNDFSTQKWVICSGFGLTVGTTYFAIANTTGDAEFSGKVSMPSGIGVTAVANLHRPVAAHKTLLIQEGNTSNDAVVQIAATNAGNVGTAIILTGQETSSDGRHWVIQHRGTGDSNAFKLGYGTTTADGQNIITGTTTFLTISTTGHMTLGGVEVLKSYTVGTLPSASTYDGAICRVTDSNVAASGNYGATVVGGGANKVKVFSNGTNWVIA